MSRLRRPRHSVSYSSPYTSSNGTRYRAAVMEDGRVGLLRRKSKADKKRNRKMRTEQRVRQLIAKRVAKLAAPSSSTSSTAVTVTENEL